MRRGHALRRVLDLNLVSLAHLAAVNRHVDLVPGVEKVKFWCLATNNKWI
jgi:hypothetical protein